MTDKEKIINGFNQGYLINSNKPELARKLLQSLKDRDDVYTKAIVSGIEESQKENSKTKPKNYTFFKPSISKSKVKTKDKDIEK